MVTFKPSKLTRKLKTRPLRNKSQEWGKTEERVKNCGATLVLPAYSGEWGQDAGMGQQ